MGTTDFVVVYDTEFWTDEGVHRRQWGGLYDYPPLLVQIGAFKLLLAGDWTIVDEFEEYIIPIDEYGRIAPITEYFSRLTGISQNMVASRGRPLEQTLLRFKEFVGDCYMYSYGNDVMGSILPSCYARSMICPFGPKQALDVRHVLLRAGMSDSEISGNTSGSLAEFFGVALPNHHRHNATSDARSIVAGLQHLRATGRIQAEWLLTPDPPPRPRPLS